MDNMCWVQIVSVIIFYYECLSFLIKRVNRRVDRVVKTNTLIEYAYSKTFILPVNIMTNCFELSKWFVKMTFVFHTI